ncbi:MAG: CDP-alcohol phosphatidyltransferase family protein [Ardenticatenaceae bacterium]
MHISPKFLADLLTLTRVVVALGILGAAWRGDRSSLPWVVAVTVLAWSGDMLDGWLAKRGGYSPISWVGRHDHEVDASLAGATMIYLWRIGLVPGWLLILLLVGTFLIWLKVRSDWVWMGFNTGSHVVAFTALLSTFPALAGIAVGWGAMVLLAGRRRAVRMLHEVRLRMRRLFNPTTQ